MWYAKRYKIIAAVNFMRSEKELLNAIKFWNYFFFGFSLALISEFVSYKKKIKKKSLNKSNLIQLFVHQLSSSFGVIVAKYRRQGKAPFIAKSE